MGSGWASLASWRNDCTTAFAMSYLVKSLVVKSVIHRYNYRLLIYWILAKNMRYLGCSCWTWRAMIEMGPNRGGNRLMVCNFTINIEAIPVPGSEHEEIVQICFRSYLLPVLWLGVLRAIAGTFWYLLTVCAGLSFQPSSRSGQSVWRCLFPLGLQRVRIIAVTCGAG